MLFRVPISMLIYSNNYFDLHICLSFQLFVSHFRVPAVISQDVTDKSCLGCDKSEIYAFWVTLRPLGLRFEVKQRYLGYIWYQPRHNRASYIKVFHHLPSVIPKQPFALSYLGRMYPRSEHFLIVCICSVKAGKIRYFLFGFYGQWSAKKENIQF